VTKRTLSAGSASATASDLRAAQQRDRLLRDELARVRAAAMAWRNGLGALLVGLIGFGLIKGRSDVGQLSPLWAGVVGATLLAALVVGAVGAMLLLRASYGLPFITPARKLLPPRVANHVETVRSARALLWGMIATLGCVVLLVTAVGATWYGPTRSMPAVQILTPAGTVCGPTERLTDGTLAIRAKAGEVSVDLSTALALAAVDSCP
jgi:hypothetical protein